MKLTEHFRRIPKKAKKQMRSALLLLLAVATFAAPAFGGGYTILKAPEVTSSAAAIEDVDLILVAASAFGEARKVMNATDNDAKDTFVNNTASIIGSYWQNMGLIIGARDALSGTIWSTYQSPITMSSSEVVTYGNDRIADAYNKYKAFGFAVENLNVKAIKSKSTAVSVEEGLDSMSVAAIKLGSFGVEFLNKYNPGPVLLSLYNSRYLVTYSGNKLVQIVNGSEVLRNVVHLFGDTVGTTGLSFFLILNAVIAVFGFALSMLLTLFGNRTIGDNIKKFLVRILIGTVGIYLIANLMSQLLDWTTSTMLSVGGSAESRYVEENLNLYDWYLTGFGMPRGTTLSIDANGQFMFTAENVRAINEYTYNRLYGGGDDAAIKAKMESYTTGSNAGRASFITPSMVSGDESAGWSTDVYYALMKNYAENKEDLRDDGGDETNPLHGISPYRSIPNLCRYTWMNGLRMNQNGDGWDVTSISSSSNYYGLNPISAFNLIRSDFSGDAITATSTVYPTIAYVAFDVTRGYSEGASTNMNAITRFIACFTLVLAALKGLITIFTAGFANLVSGGVKTALGSSHGLGQALGAVVALLLGIVGISVIMSMTMSLLDTVYGIARDLVGDSAVIDSFLQPIQDAVGGIPVLGSLIMSACRGISEMIMTLVLALTFPKLGGIPITVFAQYMSEIPGHMAEKAQMIENQIYGSRMGGGGLGGGGHMRSNAGRTAQAMASKAFSSSARQAAAIGASGLSAAGALAGASLSAAGRALNKKADGIEGKPENPGVKGWDEMSPEEQAKAAEVAASTEGWADMDEDARQKALEEGGVFGNGEAEAATSGTNAQEEQSMDAAQEDLQDAAEEITPEEAAAAAAAADSLDGEEGASVRDVGEEASMSQAAEAQAEAQAQAKEQADAMEKEAAETRAQEEKTAGAHAENMPNTGTNVSPISGGQGGEKSSSTENHAGDKKTENSTTNNAQGATTNVKEGDRIEAKTKLDSNVRQDSKMEARNVDASQSVDKSQHAETDNAAGLGEARAKDGTHGAAAAGAPGAAGLAGAMARDAKGQAGLPGQKGQSGTNGQAGQKSQAGSLGSGAARSGSAPHAAQGGTGHHTSVTQNSSQGGNTTQNISASTQSSVRSRFSDQSRLSAQNQTSNQTVQKAQDGQRTTQSVGGQQSQEARRAAGGNAGAQSMNKGTQTAKSRYGKEMSIKEQKQARALHAVGDAMQMMGGNRTIGDGVREALGHAKDAAVTYATPVELQESGFMTNLRMKRMERDRKNQNRQNGGKK